ncbi:MAG: hypothetical protein D3926_23070 [Desulfobacteraceae bacterium]|nr:MAG: hypothetical protein D3926_23070 [Desulfobacteraceae bacterium]
MKHFVHIFTALAITVGMFSSVRAEQTLVLFDDFSGSLSTNWNLGRASDQGTGTHSLAIVDGKLEFDQAYDYIESKATYGNDVMVQFDYSGGTGSFQKGDIWVELVALTDASNYTAGIYRSQYGGYNKDCINVGRAPSTSDSTVADYVQRNSGYYPPYLKELDNVSPRQGKITFAYADNKVQMRFENEGAEVINTVWVSTGNFTGTKIRIWGIGGAGGQQRYIDNVKIYAPSGTTDISPCTKVVVIPLN